MCVRSGCARPPLRGWRRNHGRSAISGKYCVCATTGCGRASPCRSPRHRSSMSEKWSRSKVLASGRIACHLNSFSGTSTPQSRVEQRGMDPGLAKEPRSAPGGLQAKHDAEAHALVLASGAFSSSAAWAQLRVRAAPAQRPRPAIHGVSVRSSQASPRSPVEQRSVLEPRDGEIGASILVFRRQFLVDRPRPAPARRPDASSPSLKRYAWGKTASVAVRVRHQLLDAEIGHRQAEAQRRRHAYRRQVGRAVAAGAHLMEIRRTKRCAAYG